MSIALVTGCSSGIGYETALKLAREGVTTFATMRSVVKAGKILDITKAEGLPLHVLPLDVTDQASVDECIKTIEEREGPVDYLVNNAGIGGSGPFEMAPLEDHYRMFETNYFGAIRMIKALLPSMRERRSGVIVNVTSMEGRIAMFDQAAYSATKFALEAASEVLAYEMRAHNVRVAIIEPGVIMTSIFENSEKQGSNHFERASPYGHVMRRNSRIFKHGFANPTTPDKVADTIWEAITTQDPKLRYPVGDDAFKLLKGRQAMTDEAYIDLGKEMSNDEYSALFKDYFDIDLYG